MHLYIGRGKTLIYFYLKSICLFRLKLGVLSPFRNNFESFVEETHDCKLIFSVYNFYKYYFDIFLVDKQLFKKN